MRPRTDRHTDTQTLVTTVHFASSATHAKCNDLMRRSVGCTARAPVLRVGIQFGNHRNISQLQTSWRRRLQRTRCQHSRCTACYTHARLALICIARLTPRIIECNRGTGVNKDSCLVTGTLDLAFGTKDFSFVVKDHENTKHNGLGNKSFVVARPRMWSGFCTSGSAIAERSRDARVTSFRKIAKWNFLATLWGT